MDDNVDVVEIADVYHSRSSMCTSQLGSECEGRKSNEPTDRCGYGHTDTRTPSGNLAYASGRAEGFATALPPQKPFFTI